MVSVSTLLSFLSRKSHGNRKPTKVVRGRFEQLEEKRLRRNPVTIADGLVLTASTTLTGTINTPPTSPGWQIGTAMWFGNNTTDYVPIMNDCSVLWKNVDLPRTSITVGNATIQNYSGPGDSPPYSSSVTIPIYSLITIPSFA